MKMPQYTIIPKRIQSEFHKMSKILILSMALVILLTTSKLK